MSPEILDTRSNIAMNLIWERQEWLEARRRLARTAGLDGALRQRYNKANGRMDRLLERYFVELHMEEFESEVSDAPN